jgi:hypothetical protein
VKPCSGFGQPFTGSLPQPCPYTVVDVVVLDGIEWATCYFHLKVFAGLITDGGAGEINRSTGLRELTWSPRRPRRETAPHDELLALVREWAT